jgi:membrane protease YdiL (CAAX protease family)
MQKHSLFSAITAIAVEQPRPSRPPVAVREAMPSSRPRLEATAVAVLLLGAVIIVSFQSFGSAAFFRSHFASHFAAWPKAQEYDFLYWFGSSVLWLFVLPVLVVAVLPGRRLNDFGLGLGNWRFGVRAAAAIYALMLPLLTLASFRPNFIDYYPMSEWVREEIHLYAAGGSSGQLTSFIVYEAAYAVYFVGWEFFHRGFLTIGLEPVLGWYAVLVVAIPFGILHVGKPMPEPFGAIVASLVLGWLAIRTRSSWYGFALHASIAVTMDLLAVAHQV